MVIGAGIYAAIYPRLSNRVLKAGEFDKETIPQFFGVKPWPVITLVALAILITITILELNQA